MTIQQLILGVSILIFSVCNTGAHGFQPIQAANAIFKHTGLYDRFVSFNDQISSSVGYKPKTARPANSAQHSTTLAGLDRPISQAQLAGMDQVWQHRPAWRSRHLQSAGPCGAGLEATRNRSVDICGGVVVAAAQRSIIEAAAGASGGATGPAVTGAAVAVSGSSAGAQAIVAAGSAVPIPAGFNYSTLPPSLVSAAVTSANVSNSSQLTNFGQLLGPTVAANSSTNVSLAQALTALQVGTAANLLANITCEDGWQLQATCACPVDYAGSACGTRLNVSCKLVPSVEPASQPAGRALVATDRDYATCMSSHSSDDTAVHLTSSIPANWAESVGWTPKRAGVPPCLLYASSAVRRQGRALQLQPSVLNAQMQCDWAASAPAAFSCNGTTLDAAGLTELLPDSNTSAYPGPFYGLACREAEFRYVLGPSTAEAAVAARSGAGAARALASATYDVVQVAPPAMVSLPVSVPASAASQSSIELRSVLRGVNWRTPFAPLWTRLGPWVPLNASTSGNGSTTSVSLSNPMTLADIASAEVDGGRAWVQVAVEAQVLDASAKQALVDAGMSFPGAQVVVFDNVEWRAPEADSSLTTGEIAAIVLGIVAVVVAGVVVGWVYWSRKNAATHSESAEE